MEESLRTDFILLTHNHGDHTCVESTDRIRAAFPAVRYVAPEESASALVDSGVDSSAITTVTAGDSAEIGSMTAHVVYAKPPDGDPDNQIDPPDVQHLGFVVDAGVRVYFSGDPINTFAEPAAATVLRNNGSCRKSPSTTSASSMVRTTTCARSARCE